MISNIFFDSQSPTNPSFELIWTSAAPLLSIYIHYFYYPFFNDFPITSALASQNHSRKIIFNIGYIPWTKIEVFH